VLVGYIDFPRELQFTRYTCGPCCTYAIASFFGADVSYTEVLDAVGTTSEGTAEGPIVRFLRSCDLRVAPRERLSWLGLVRALKRGNVVLVGLDDDHYGVVHAIDEDEDIVYLADPSVRRQLRRWTPIQRFKQRWMNDGVIVRPRHE